jgi:endogenous inhibitor of DNA gyrase (YacG/DUF329 family)
VNDEIGMTREVVLPASLSASNILGLCALCGLFSVSPMKTRCPICKTEVTGRDDPVRPNSFFPFCSDRCKLIDLGRWLDGKYQVPVREEQLEDDDQGLSSSARKN